MKVIFLCLMILCVSFLANGTENYDYKYDNEKRCYFDIRVVVAETGEKQMHFFADADCKSDLAAIRTTYCHQFMSAQPFIEFRLTIQTHHKNFVNNWEPCVQPNLTSFSTVMWIVVGIGLLIAVATFFAANGKSKKLKQKRQETIVQFSKSLKLPNKIVEQV